jgi:hypothetical protein
MVMDFEIAFVHLEMDSRSQGFVSSSATHEWFVSSALKISRAEAGSRPDFLSDPLFYVFLSGCPVVPLGPNKRAVASCWWLESSGLWLEAVA